MDKALADRDASKREIGVILFVAMLGSGILGNSSSLAFRSPVSPLPTPTAFAIAECPLAQIPEYRLGCRRECLKCSNNGLWLECDPACMDWQTSPLVPPTVEPVPTPKPDYCFVFGFPCTDFNPGAPEGCMCWCDAPMWCPE